MAKTEEIDAWGLFGTDDKLSIPSLFLSICESEERAMNTRLDGETVRPVKIVWGVD